MNDDVSSICQSCGACCSNNWNVYFPKNDNDIPTEMSEQTSLLGLSKMKSINGRCCALDGEVGKKVTCTIYDKRPQICKSFEYGSQDCLKIKISSLNTK
jgi:Fe-S-cluster containining protein